MRRLTPSLSSAKEEEILPIDGFGLRLLFPGFWWPLHPFCPQQASTMYEQLWPIGCFSEEHAVQMLQLSRAFFTTALFRFVHFISPVSVLPAWMCESSVTLAKLVTLPDHHFHYGKSSQNFW